jgi:hypothetical protein
MTKPALITDVIGEIIFRISHNSMSHSLFWAQGYLWTLITPRAFYTNSLYHWISIPKQFIQNICFLIMYYYPNLSCSKSLGLFSLLIHSASSSPSSSISFSLFNEASQLRTHSYLQWWPTTAKPSPNQDNAGPVVRRPMGLPITASCDTARDQTRDRTRVYSDALEPGIIVLDNETTNLGN